MSKIQQGFAYNRITKLVHCVNYHECLNYVFFPTTEEALFFSQEILGVLHVIQVPFSLHLLLPIASGRRLLGAAWKVYTIIFWMPTVYTANRLFFTMGTPVRPYPIGSTRQSDTCSASPSVTLLETNSVSGISV